MPPLKPLYETVLDLTLLPIMNDTTHARWKRSGARVRVIAPPQQFIQWTPFRLWTYTGFKMNKLKHLQRHYLNPKELNVMIGRIPRILEQRTPFSVSLYLGSENTMEKTTRLKKSKTHQRGECLSGLSFHFTYRGKIGWTVILFVTWRASQMGQRFFADIIMLDNIFHDVLDPFDLYDKIEYVVFTFGEIWIAHFEAGLLSYVFPGLERLIPSASAFRKEWDHYRTLALNNPNPFARKGEDGYVIFSPRRRAVRALHTLKKQKVPPMFLIPLSAKRLHPRARESDFPRFTFRGGTGTT